MEASDYFDLAELEAATEEEVFDGAAADLLNALVGAITEVAQLLPPDDGGTRPWNRDEAVCAGLVVRCGKLLRAYESHFGNQEFEICNYLMRGIKESLVNLLFLLRFGTVERLSRFRALSFRGDKQMLTLIERNIQERGGLILPIEERITSAIQRRLTQANVDLSEVPDGGRENWGGTDKEKLEALEIEDLYQALFVGPSTYVHGTWHELVMYHLRDAEEESGFEPTPTFSAVRPQYALGLCRLAAAVVREYLVERLIEAVQTETLMTRLSSIEEAAVEVEQHHENYIGRTGGPELGS